ncbi:uncharacterized protein LOC101853432 isoform X2 [Aplysia californica]|uniref:Uncharacterized protein LOC101853432 isoform X2 n=1 Tax=Aplysia californica TaxID=6500 RepID=A0ABM1VZY7_APLCA|nr:uncharacterized protein LOC101853432 isoform X2 [Aplysia californica]
MMTSDSQPQIVGCQSGVQEPVYQATPKTRFAHCYLRSRLGKSPLQSSSRPGRSPVQSGTSDRRTPDVVVKTSTRIFSNGKEENVISGNHYDVTSSSLCTPPPWRYTGVGSISTVASFVDDKVSPGLARLRMTPGAMREKQRQLIRKHNAIRKRSDQLQTGGGVSLWPNMKEMRLSKSEVVKLSLQAVALCIFTKLILQTLHGDSFQKLQNYTTLVQTFCTNNSILRTTNEEQLRTQVLLWHTGLLELTNQVQSYFNMPVTTSSYQLYIFSYLIGLGVLVYYLLDNILAKNKLTPSRIRKWTCLLIVIGTWTVVMAHGLLLAYSLEKQVVKCVQKYSDSLHGPRDGVSTFRNHVEMSRQLWDGMYKFTLKCGGSVVVLSKKSPSHSSH